MEPPTQPPPPLPPPSPPPTPPPPAPPRFQKVYLDLEQEERQLDKIEVGTQANGSEEKTTAQGMKEKLKKPTISFGLLLYLMLNSGQFFVGVATTNDCPIKPIIPIYLAVAGAIGMVSKLTPILNRHKRIKVVDWIVFALFVVEIIWMILGSYWIYSIYKPNYHPDKGLYCNKVAYRLAFWFLTINYIGFIFVITLPCCILCCFCVCGLFSDSKKEPTA